MNRLVSRALLGLALCLAAVPALAQPNPLRNANGVPYTAPLGCDGVTPASVSNPLCVTGGGGGGGGGASATAAANGTVVTTAGTNKPQAIDLFGSTSSLIKDATGAAVDWTAPVPVTKSGTWALDTGTANIGDVDVLTLPALAAGSNIIGNVRIDQTTAGTTNAVSVSQISGVATATGNGVVTGGTQRVAIASDNTAIPANTSQINGVTPLMGNGVTGTGSQRVTIASDNTPFTVTAAQATAANLNAQVVGAVVSTGTNAGNPVKIGAVFTTAPPTFTTGQIGDLQMTTNGSLRVMAGVNSAAGADSVANNIGFFGRNDTSANTGPVAMAQHVFNGTNWDRTRTIGDATTAASGVGVAAVAYAPTSAAGQAIVPSASTAVEAFRVLKASAGNLYRLVVNTGASAGWVGVSNTTSNPIDGAVTPLVCRQVAANSTLVVDYAQLPARFTTGISAWFSTTGCFTKTQSATATFEGFVQ